MVIYFRIARRKYYNFPGFSSDICTVSSSILGLTPTVMYVQLFELFEFNRYVDRFCQIHSCGKRVYLQSDVHTYLQSNLLELAEIIYTYLSAEVWIEISTRPWYYLIN